MFGHRVPYPWVLLVLSPVFCLMYPDSPQQRDDISQNQSLSPPFVYSIVCLMAAQPLAAQTSGVIIASETLVETLLPAYKAMPGEPYAQNSWSTSAVSCSINLKGEEQRRYYHCPSE